MDKEIRRGPPSSGGGDYFHHYIGHHDYFIKIIIMHIPSSFSLTGAVAEIKRELEEGLGLWRAQLLAAQVEISMIVMMTMMMMTSMIM